MANAPIAAGPDDLVHRGVAVDQQLLGVPDACAADCGSPSPLKLETQDYPRFFLRGWAVYLRSPSRCRIAISARTMMADTPSATLL
jgi:hypothetical protein